MQCDVSLGQSRIKQTNKLRNIPPQKFKILDHSNDLGIHCNRFLDTTFEYIIKTTE